MEPDPAAGRSTRTELADLAHAAVGEVPGVVLVPAPGLQRVAAALEREETGVSATAQGDGAYELDLCLRVGWPSEPLPDLAEAVRGRVVAAAAAAGLATELGAVNVLIADITAPGEAVE